VTSYLIIIGILPLRVAAYEYRQPEEGLREDVETSLARMRLPWRDAGRL